MQKIPFYLLPNRITLTTDRTGSVMEFRKVYQRHIKLYKGIDNTIELEIKNNEQRRENVIGREVQMHFFDQNHKKLFTSVGTARAGTVGIMTVTVPQQELDFLNPQMLKVAVKFSDDEVLYSDAQFGLFITAELFDGFNERLMDVLDEITVFNYEFDLNKYVSEIVRFGTNINDDYSSVPSRSLSVEVITSDYTQDITVQATSDKSTAFGTTWTDIGTISPAAFNTEVSFVGNHRFIRFVFPKYTDDIYKTLAGTVDKIIIRN